jgi:N-methylhydantoinase B
MTETSNQERRVDPVTFEVIRHRLMAITEEQGAAVEAIAGSPHVSEAHDYNVGLYLPSGEVATMGRSIVTHSAAMASITRFVIEDCAEDPGFHPGDMFIVNNPWKGTAHAQDVAVVAPIFHDGELLAWTSSMCHMVDVGGSRPGSFCVDAIDCFAEGLQMPPMKLVDGGTIRTDLWNLIMTSTRMPAAFDLDLRALIGANNTALRAVGNLAGKYGTETVQSVMSTLIETSDRRLRARLAELPDVRLRSTAYLDNEGGSGVLYDVDLVLTKSGDTLHFDYSGSSPQAPNYINCTRSGLLAALAGALLPTLAFDIPWNAGLFNVLEIEAPDGLICTASRPAPVSGGALEAAWLVELTALEAISKLSAISDGLLTEAQAAPAGGPDQFVLSGVNQHGENFTHVVFDCVATGGGAYARRDGLWTQGQHSMELVKVANAEQTELEVPLVYLDRSLTIDSGGAGRKRGGQSLGATYLTRGSEVIRTVTSGHGWEVPNSTGIFGGFPGAQNDREVVLGSDMSSRLAAGSRPALAELEGERPTMHGRQGLLALGPEAVLSIVSQAGGGWGDPLDRDLGELADDLRYRAVSPDAASRIYGAVLTGGRIDVPASLVNRERLRRERAGWPVDRERPEQPAEQVRVAPMGDQLALTEGPDGRFVSCRCGYAISRADRPWREFAAMSVVSGVHGISRATRLADSLELRQYACPSCGVLHATDVVRRGDGHRNDIELLEPEAAYSAVRAAALVAG